MALVPAIDIRTGETVWVPQRWIDHPVLGEHLSKPSGQSAGDPAAAPDPEVAVTTTPRLPGTKKE